MNPKLLLQSDAGDISHQALAAKNIKEELRCAFPGIKFSVRSEGFSMGDAVRISWDNGPTVKEVDAIVQDYCNSEFDGMQDLSSYVKKAKHIYGSTKYVTTSRGTRELCETIESLLKPLIPQDQHHQMFSHENLAYRISCRVSLKPGQSVVGMKRNEVRASSCFSDFWKAVLSGEEKELPKLEGGQVIHTKHTQKGHDLFVVQLPIRVDRDAFKSFLAEAKSLGGYYSSYDLGGAVPGFQFRDDKGAQSFLAIVAGLNAPQAAEAKQEAQAEKSNRQIAKLRALADGMEATIDSKINSATSQQNPTRRRIAMAESMRHDGLALQRTQAALRRIADALEAKETLPFEFLTLAWSKSVVHEALRGRGLPSLVEWLKSVPKVEEDPLKKRIREIEQGFVGQKIPGYFPTPGDLVERMLAHVNVSEGDLILEPSAGSGSIATALNHGSITHCCEIRPALVELLKLKGQRVVASDFMEYHPGPIYSAVVMNPPFEDSQAVSHILHAWECLKPGGRLVAIAPESIMFNDSQEYQKLRGFLDEHGADIEDIEAGAFEKSGTMVKTRMVIVNK